MMMGLTLGLQRYAQSAMLRSIDMYTIRMIGGAVLGQWEYKVQVTELKKVQVTELKFAIACAKEQARFFPDIYYFAIYDSEGKFVGRVKQETHAIWEAA